MKTYRPENFDEARHDALQKQLRNDTTWPALPAGQSVLHRQLLHACVFGLSARTASNARALSEYNDISDTSRGASVQYYGAPLLQADLRVLLGLVQLSAGQHCSEVLDFDAGAFLQSIGRAHCSRSVDALVHSLSRLRSATFTVRSYKKDSGRIFGLIAEGDWDTGRKFKVRISPQALGALRSLSGTRVDMTKRNLLADGVQTALADWLRSTSADSYDVKALADLWGREDAKELGREVRAALDRLVEVGLVASWTATRGRVHVVRSVYAPA